MRAEDIINKVIGVEGGYVNNPNDSGGATRFGITEAVARQNGYMGPMKDLPVNIAQIIYKNQYWKPLKLDSIIIQSPAVAEELFDTAVNQGVTRAAMFLQRSLRVLNRQGRDYPDIPVDGSVGPQTINAFSSFMWQRGKSGEKVLLRMLNCLQGAFYIDLAEKRSKDEDFIFGWFSNRVS